MKRYPPSSSNIKDSKYKPVRYQDMDDWLNEFSVQEWTAVIGAYAAGGITSVVQYLKQKYPNNLEMWREKDLRHFFNSRRLTDFRAKAERAGK